jgi:hypothetical protein
MRDEIAASNYVFTEEERARVNALLSQYVGTHNFHNYTVRRRRGFGVVGVGRCQIAGARRLWGLERVPFIR